MADRDPARPAHAGPTVLADIDGLSNPDQAPHTIRFPSAMAAILQQQWQRSFPGGHAREHGGTIVADGHGRLSIQNIGGLASSAGAFLPKLMLDDPARFKLVGVFHTHPYDRQDRWVNGVAFSGADMGALMLTRMTISVLQSGLRQFVFLRTALSPAYVDKAAADASVNAEVQMRVKAGQTFQQASRIISRGRALQYGFAYYQGANGVVTRV